MDGKHSGRVFSRETWRCLDYSLHQTGIQGLNRFSVNQRKNLNGGQSKHKGQRQIPENTFET